MDRPGKSGRPGDELYEIVLAVEELLGGGELSGQELAELVNAADPLPDTHREAPDRPL